MASVEELLLKALDNLESQKLKRFKWHLKKLESISAADVEKPETSDIVDVMVARFGEEAAVENTLVILRKMNENNLASQLEKWTATTKKDEPNLTDLKKDEPRLNTEADKARYFDNNWSDLIQKVTNVKIIADRLLLHNIIHEEQYSQITHASLTTADSMRKICDIIRRRSDSVKALFISILQEVDKNLFH
ncbi:NACHT, LRR and PYD domains-containing protein 1 homolog [Labeo rohita]|uniref:NACHT, LRR and PYD domains-containing protein 1 homolog n=1 Tax=Labeo rohita TaxID=84645 RepID=UPI0021E22AD6|nr:NACHT, LRR and PYD domains-containing protein 1 homolog [Labeo rohita]XP_050957395.1 NACHT, LRR and PYD domains-containing protein 1 homolog [Labeo rohita]